MRGGRQRGMQAGAEAARSRRCDRRSPTGRRGCRCACGVSTSTPSQQPQQSVPAQRRNMGLRSGTGAVICRLLLRASVGRARGKFGLLASCGDFQPRRCGITPSRAMPGSGAIRRWNWSTRTDSTPSTACAAAISAAEIDRLAEREIVGMEQAAGGRRAARRSTARLFDRAQHVGCGNSRP